MHRTLELLDTAFMVDMIVGFEDVDRAKPDPTMVVAVKQATGLPSERMLYLGRGRADLSLAQRADVPYRDYRRSFAQKSPQLREAPSDSRTLAIGNRNDVPADTGSCAHRRANPSWPRCGWPPRRG